MSKKVTWFWPCACCLPWDDRPVPQLWWMLWRLYYPFEAYRGLYVTKCHENEPWMKPECERRGVTNPSGHWSVNVNCYLFPWPVRYLITSPLKRSPLFYPQCLLAIKGCCSDWVMPKVRQVTKAGHYSTLCSPDPCHSVAHIGHKGQPGDPELWPQWTAWCWGKEGGKKGLTHLFLCLQSSPQSNKCHRQQVWDGWHVQRQHLCDFCHDLKEKARRNFSRRKCKWKPHSSLLHGNFTLLWPEEALT